MPRSTRKRVQLSDRQRAAVLDAIEAGLPRSSAAKSARLPGGIGQLDDALRDSPKLRLDLDEAEAHCERRLLLLASETSHGARWAMERRFMARWGAERKPEEELPPIKRGDKVTSVEQGLERIRTHCDE